MTFLNETWIVFTRAMRLGFREPVWLFIALSQPILYLALFGPLLDCVFFSRAASMTYPGRGGPNQQMSFDRFHVLQVSTGIRSGDVLRARDAAFGASR